MNFASDNAAGIAPEILAAMARANDGQALAYGRDDWTQRLEHRLAEMFEHELAVFLVGTGTAANALALAHLTPPWGAVVCHSESHIATDECGAPEFFGGGLKLLGIEGTGCKIEPDVLKRTLSGRWGGPHHVRPTVLSISQATEAGAVYPAHEIRQLADIAHAHGLTLHVDGARFGNALVPGGSNVEGRRRCAVLRRHQRRCARSRSGGVLRSRPRRVYGGATQARGTSPLQASLRCRSARGLLRGRPLAAACAPCECHGGPSCRGPCRPWH